MSSDRHAVALYAPLLPKRKIIGTCADCAYGQEIPNDSDHVRCTNYDALSDDGPLLNSFGCIHWESQQ